MLSPQMKTVWLCWINGATEQIYPAYGTSSLEFVVYNGPHEPYQLCKCPLVYVNGCDDSVICIACGASYKKEVTSAADIIRKMRKYKYKPVIVCLHEFLRYLWDAIMTEIPTAENAVADAPLEGVTNVWKFLQCLHDTYQFTHMEQVLYLLNYPAIVKDSYSACAISNALFTHNKRYTADINIIMGMIIICCNDDSQRNQIKYSKKKGVIDKAVDRITKAYGKK
jgi:hypothetical protein